MKTPAHPLRPERPRTITPLVQHRWLIVATVVAAWTVDWLAYAEGELGLDGHLSVGLAVQPIDRILTFLSRDVHPPLYYLGLDAWLRVAGVNVVAARWPTIAASLLTLVLLWRLIGSLAAPLGTLGAILLLVLSPAQIAAAATARDFSVGLCLSVGSLVVWRELDRQKQPSARRWLAVSLGVLTALALATWYFHLVFLAIQLVDSTARRRLGPAIGLLGGAGAQLRWWIRAAPALLAKLTHGVSASGAPASAASPEVIVGALARVLAGTLPIAHLAVLGTLPWIILTCLGFAFGWGAGRPWRGLPLLGSGFGFVVVSSLLIVWAQPNLLGRYALILLPWTALGQAWAVGNPLPFPPAPRRESEIGERPRRPFPTTPWGAGIGGAITLLFLLALTVQAADYASLLRSQGWPWQRQPPTDPAFAYITAHSQPGDAILFGDLARRGQYALEGREPLPATTIHFAGAAFLRDDVPTTAASLLPGLASQHARVWFLYDPPADQSSLGTIERQLLQLGWYRLDQKKLGRANVELFAPGPALTDQQVGATFGDTFRLGSWALDSTVTAGQPLHVALNWTDLRPASANYTIFAHLVGDNRQTIAQYDAMPALGFAPTSTWQPGQKIQDRFVIGVPEATTPGTYHLELGLYQGDRRLKLADGSDALDLGPIAISPP
jgi:hypothetical protein